MEAKFLRGVGLIACLPLLAAGAARAEMAPDDPGWNHTVNLRLGLAEYSRSPIHDDFNAQWLYLEGENPRWGGYLAGGGRLTRNFIPGQRDVHQDDLFGEFHRHFPAFKGRLTAGLYLHHADTDHPSGASDDVLAVEPRVGWLSGDKRLYLDLGYARSDYPRFHVDQWTPTVGLNFGPASLRLRGHLIDPSNANPFRRDDTKALETTLVYRLAQGAPLGLRAASLTYLAGERLYSVDSDLYFIQPLGNLQTDSYRVGLQFQPTERIGVGVMAGTNRMATPMFKFDMDYVGVNLAYRW